MRMFELKSKRNGRTHVLNEDEYNEIVRKGVFPIKNFIVTELQLREIIPLKEEKVIKPKITKKKE